MGGLCERLDVGFWTLAGREGPEVVSSGDLWVSGDGPGRSGLTARRPGRSEARCSSVPRGLCCLRSIVRAMVSKSRSSRSSWWGESRFFRGCGHQEVHGACAAVFSLGGQLFLGDAGAAVDTVGHGAPGVVGVEGRLHAGAVRSGAGRVEVFRFGEVADRDEVGCDRVVPLGGVLAEEDAGEGGGVDEVAGDGHPCAPVPRSSVVAPALVGRYALLSSSRSMSGAPSATSSRVWSSARRRR